VSKRIWKAGETKAEKTGVVEAKERREKRKIRKEKRKNREKEEKIKN